MSDGSSLRSVSANENVKAPAVDQVIRAMTTDGAFRVIAAITTSTTLGATTAQEADGELALRLAELMTGAILVRETTQPARRVQIVWRDRGGSSIVGDALPDGSNRGLINPGARDREPVLVGDHVLQVNYTLPNGAMHQGMVGIADGTDMASALMQYLHESEQILAMVALAALPGPNGIRVAGGYLVQILPEATRETIGELTDRLGNLPPMAQMLDGTAVSAEALVAHVMHGFTYEHLARSDVRFGCTCSEGRVLQSMLTLSEEEIDSMVAGQPLDVRCDACGARYQIATTSLAAMRELKARGGQPS